MVREKGTERRRHPRRGVLATATVFSANQLLGTFKVRDLSAGGARFEGRVTARAGTRVSIVLHLPGRAPFSVAARMLRQDGRGGPRAFSVSFIDLAPEDEDTIQEAVVSALEREEAKDAAKVLVLDRDGDGRAALERELRRLGHESMAVSTPLDALDFIERPGGHVEMLLVDLSLGASQALDLLDFVGEHHPRIRRVAISDEIYPFRLDLALRSGRAHAVLRRPFGVAQLGASLSGNALA